MGMLHAERPTAPEPSARPRRSKTKLVLLILLALVLILVGGLALTGFLVSERLAGQVKRTPAFEQIPEEERPRKPTTGGGADALNFLLVGTDERSDGQEPKGEDTTKKWRRGSGRSDTIMVLHITADRQKAYIISIPRDSWVSIPGEGENKINAAYSFGGPTLTIRTVEKLTGLRLDHYAAIDWDGFKALTDALGGVKMTFPEPTKLSSGRTVPAGTHTLSGEEALDYVRKRKGLQGGDFGRIKRQQNFMRSLMRQTLSGDTLTNPGKLTSALDAITKNLWVDNGLDANAMRSLAIDMRDLRSNDVTFMTVPLDEDNPTPMRGSQSTVQLDMKRVKSLFAAVRKDETDAWIAKNDADTLGKNVD